MNNIRKWTILFCTSFIVIPLCVIIIHILIGDDVDKINKLAIECSAGKQEACEEIAEIAKNSSDPKARKLAVAKLSDQKLLADIAVNEFSSDVGKDAVNKVTDQKLLADIAKNTYNEGTAFTAIARPSLKDQKLLIDIAKNCHSSSIGVAAVENPNLTDQALLISLLRLNDGVIRQAAVKKITDLTILSKIAVEDFSAGDEALKNIIEHVKISLSSSDYGKITTADNFLKQIEKTKIDIKTVNENDKTENLIYKYLTALEPDPIHGDIDSEDMLKLFLAIRDLSHPTLASVAGDIENVFVNYDWHRKDYQKENTQEIRSYESPDITLTIILHKLGSISYEWKAHFPVSFRESENPIIYPRIDSNDFIKMVLSTITDQKMLSEIARKHGDFEVRKSAIEKLTDRKMLSDLYKDKDLIIQGAAEKRLKELQGK